MTTGNAAKRLEKEFGSHMFVSKDGRITFSAPASALKRTILGDPDAYWVASGLMRLAAVEHSLNRLEESLEARKAESSHGRD